MKQLSMAKALFFLILVAMLSRLVVIPAYASTSADLAEDIMQRYQPTIDKLGGHGWDHSNSVILHGIEKQYLKSKKPEQLAYIRQFVDDHVNDDGSVDGLRDTLDGMHPGVLCLFLYRETGEKKYLLAAKAMRDHLLGSGDKQPAIPKTPDGGYWHKNLEKYQDVMSVDGIYMAYPFLLRYGLLAGDKEAIEVALAQTLLVSEKSFNHKAGLPYHAWDYNKKKSWADPQTGQSTQFWSRASGWYAMALVDMLEVLPDDHKDYPHLFAYYHKLTEGLMRWQDKDTGLWFHVIDKADKEGNYPEMAGSGMMVYSLAKGARLGLLDEDAVQSAKKGWQGMQKFIKSYKDGGLQVQSVAPGMSCQDNYEAYVRIRPVSIPREEEKQHPHGYMSVLLAGSEME